MKKYLYDALLIILSMGFYSIANAKNPCQLISVSPNLKKLPSYSSQVILVRSDGATKAQITACQLHKTRWESAFKSSFWAVVGEAGIASIGKKKEGDMKTPAGLYPLGEAFGTQSLALKMDYKFITPDDKFIDDPKHKKYNMWVNGSTDAKSYETMLISAYKMGLVINYNMNPTIPGAGSAIFMHLWQSEKKPTFGCIATDEKSLLTLLQWLDKKQHPYIYITSSL